MTTVRLTLHIMDHFRSVCRRSGRDCYRWVLEFVTMRLPFSHRHAHLVYGRACGWFAFVDTLPLDLFRLPRLDVYTCLPTMPRISAYWLPARFAVWRCLPFHPAAAHFPLRLLLPPPFFFIPFNAITHRTAFCLLRLLPFYLSPLWLNTHTIAFVFCSYSCLVRSTYQVGRHTLRCYTCSGHS